jgi:hypothetical protein
VDPLTGKADWRLIHQGQQKTTIKGFFGQELAGMTANLGSAQGMNSGVGTAIGGNTNIGATSPLASGFGGASVPTGASGSTGSTGSSGGGMFGDGEGGGPIVGVGTSRSGQSILEPNQQTTYETWEFWYDPRIELLKQGVSITGGGLSSTSASNFGQNINGQSNGANGASGSTGSSSSFGSFGSPSTPTTHP